ncbi:TPA: hypothetical protein ACJFV9_004394 [Salmonella enterica subsp. enterica serovar Infantis]
MNNDNGNIDNVAVLLHGIYEQLQEKENEWYLSKTLNEKTDKSDLQSEQFGN